MSQNFRPFQDETAQIMFNKVFLKVNAGSVCNISMPCDISESVSIPYSVTESILMTFSIGMQVDHEMDMKLNWEPTQW